MKFPRMERYRDLVDDFCAFEDALTRRLPTTGWVNSLKSSREELYASFDAAGVAYRPLSWNPSAFQLLGKHAESPGRRIEYLLGHFQVQEEVAMLPVMFMNPQPGQRILDMCAAPGNKTGQLGVAMANRGTLIANDRSTSRMRAIRDALDRLGLVNVVLTNYDAANFPTPSQRFDAVLADVPCSCEGTSRKNPDTLDEIAEDIYESLGRAQRAMLERAFRVCRPGGVVVYSTCTYAPEENEMVIEEALKRIPFAPEWIPCRIPGFVSSPGLTHWNGRDFDPQMHQAMRVWPHQNDTGGFFVAAWRKPERW